MSMRFVEQPSHVNWARYLTTYSTPTAQSYTEATRRLDDPKLSNETTFNAASGTDLSFLSSCDTSEGLALKYTLEGFELDKLGRANMVDPNNRFCGLFAVPSLSSPEVVITPTIDHRGFIIDLSTYSGIELSKEARAVTIKGSVLVKPLAIALVEAGMFTGKTKPFSSPFLRKQYAYGCPTPLIQGLIRPISIALANGNTVGAIPYFLGGGTSITNSVTG
ncbi:MAG: hypothetical protein L6R40_004616 [Gallowayella cf. fulva]|nr:MAG: hypothetical protein L6R40_004616 [Xanthomendoza cf. fulva]